MYARSLSWLFPWFPFAAYLDLPRPSSPELDLAQKRLSQIQNFIGDESSQRIQTPPCSPLQPFLTCQRPHFRDIDDRLDLFRHLYSAGNILANDFFAFAFASGRPWMPDGIMHPFASNMTHFPSFKGMLSFEDRAYVPIHSKSSDSNHRPSSLHFPQCRVLASFRPERQSLSDSCYVPWPHPFTPPNPRVPPSLQHSRYRQFLRSLTTPTPSHTSLAHTSEIISEQSTWIDCLSTPTASSPIADAAAPSRSRRNRQQDEHPTRHHFHFLPP